MMNLKQKRPVRSSIELTPLEIALSAVDFLETLGREIGRENQHSFESRRATPAACEVFFDSFLQRPRGSAVEAGRLEA
jgi:hypothetical protein